MDTEKLIDAAVAYATQYDDDDRECIKTDVINAFYAGAALGKKLAFEELKTTDHSPE